MGQNKCKLIAIKRRKLEIFVVLTIEKCVKEIYFKIKTNVLVTTVVLLQKQYLFPA